MNNKIIVICGFSGCGKDTIAKILKSKGYSFIQSVSTRPMREGESYVNPYRFTDNTTFKGLIKRGKLAEYRKYDTIQEDEPAVWYYGILKRDIVNNKKYVVVLDLQGTKDIKEIYGDRVISFYIDVDDETREQRAIDRKGFEQAEWNRRLKDDKKKFTKKVIDSVCDYRVENYDLDKCVNEILEIIK